MEVRPYPRILEALDAAERERLVASARRRTVPAGALVNAQHDARRDVAILEAGWVKAYFAGADGRSLTFAYWRDGMLLGTPALAAPPTYQWTTEAVTDCTLLLVERGRFAALMESGPRLSRVVIELLEFKAAILSDLVQGLGVADVEGRLRLVLRHLATLYGSDAPGGRRIGLVLSHAEIADMIGASRPWASRAMKRLAEAGEIVVERRAITVTERLGARVTG